MEYIQSEKTLKSLKADKKLKKTSQVIYSRVFALSEWKFIISYKSKKISARC